MTHHTTAVYAMLALMLTGGLFGPSPVNAQTMGDYAAAPPYISGSVVPNIMLIYDSSGSMRRFAHADSGTFSSSTVYSGIFDPLECYQYSVSSFQPDPAGNPISPGTCTTAPYDWSGNLLNFTTMRRNDIAKVAMIGGICATGGRDADSKCTTTVKGQSTGLSSGTVQVDWPLTNLMPASLILNNPVNFDHQGDGTFQVESTPFQIAAAVTTPAFGVIQDVGDKARLGVMIFSKAGNTDGAQVEADIGSSIPTLVSAVEAVDSSGGTPLAESLYEASRYFAQVAPFYDAGHYTYTVPAQDPYYFTAPTWASVSSYVDCCKSYVILFTDGEATSDLNVPAVLQGMADAVGGDGSIYHDDVAYWAHLTDLRQATIPDINETGKALLLEQTLTLYTVFAFGNGSTLLQTAAKMGGFEDTNGNNEPDLQAEWDKLINATGAAGTDGIPDTYFEASDAGQLKNRLTSAISSIIGQSKSGTAAAVQASSTSGEGAVYQAHFFPSQVEGIRQIKWTGYLQSFFVDTFGNLREDSNGDGRFVYADDKIVEARTDVLGQVSVDRFVDVSPADGKKDSATPTDTVAMTAVKPLWEAGKELALRDEVTNPRNIITWVDADNDGAVDSGEQMAFTTGNAATLAPYLRAGAAPYTATNIIDFIRGAQVTGMRDRYLTVGGTPNTVWRLGDSINSSPTVVGAPAERYGVIYGDSTYDDFFVKYKNRRQVVYMGGNDGMLHAFNAGYYHKGDDPGTPSPKYEQGYFTTAPNDNNSGAKRGEELWGFIPYQLLPHLQWLTRQDYSHVYYVDLKPKITDARIFTADATHPNGWGTILIGGFRLGGSCGDCTAGNARTMEVTADFGSGVETRQFYTAYFVLDITDPEQDPKLLYSYSEANLGLSTNFPAIVRASTNTNASDNAAAKWYIVTGSGPIGFHGVGPAGKDAKMVSLEMTKPWALGNTLVRRDYATNDKDSIFTGVVSLDKDLDYRADVLYTGTANKKINPTWRGTAYRLTTNGGNPSTLTWGVNKAGARQPTKLLDSFSCFPKPCGGNTKVGPISAAPTVTKDDSGNYWVFFGTGRLWIATDRTHAEQQYFMGLKDPVLTGSCTENSVINCEQNDLVKVTSAVVCVVCDAFTDEVTGIAGVTDLHGTAPSTLQGLIASKDGWFTELPKARERVLFSPTLLGGIVWFPTFAPTANICDSSGEGELYALFYLTGSAYNQSVIGTETVGANTNVKKSLALGSGIASQAAVHLGAMGTDPGSGVSGRMKVCTQTSSGAVRCSRAKAPLSAWSHYMSWISQGI